MEKQKMDVENGNDLYQFIIILDPLVSPSVSSESSYLAMPSLHHHFGRKNFKFRWHLCLLTLWRLNCLPKCASTCVCCVNSAVLNIIYACTITTRMNNNVVPQHYYVQLNCDCICWPIFNSPCCLKSKFEVRVWHRQVHCSSQVQLTTYILDKLFRLYGKLCCPVQGLPQLFGGCLSWVW